MKSSTKVVIIVAMAENRVIGVDGDLPWDIPVDMNRFKLLTSGNPVILGRKTHQNIVEKNGGTLPDRTHVVVTSSPSEYEFEDGVIVTQSIEEALETGEKICHTSRSGSCIYVAGGGSIYEQTLDYADKIELTRIKDSFEGDTYFPQFDTSNWVEKYHNKQDGFEFVSLEKVQKPISA